MDRITRKTLKDDRFAAEVTHSVEYLAEHRRQTLIYGGAAVVVAALALGIFFYRQNRKNAVHMALFRALETYHAAVSPEDVPGRITFRTEAEKNTQARKEFESVVSGFSRTDEAGIARYYQGLIYYQEDNVAEAQKRLEQLVAEGPGSVPSLARLTLAEIYTTQGKDEEARKMYEYLIKNPTDLVSESRAQLAMARFLGRRKPEEARKLLLDLEKRPGAVAAAAGTMLREMSQQ
ncbi:MAG: tetratricopeptide repeat protein [Acidobacteria bacterium]|nr:tetratricopeptide repeat protein [Acidobacteriota bacterium]